MLEYLKINQVASFYSDEIKIWIVDNEIHYSVLSMKSGTNIEDAVSDYDIEKLNTTIEAMGGSGFMNVNADNTLKRLKKLGIV